MEHFVYLPSQSVWIVAHGAGSCSQLPRLGALLVSTSEREIPSSLYVCSRDLLDVASGAVLLCPRIGKINSVSVRPGTGLVVAGAFARDCWTLSRYRSDPNSVMCGGSMVSALVCDGAAEPKNR